MSILRKITSELQNRKDIGSIHIGGYNYFPGRNNISTTQEVKIMFAPKAPIYNARELMKLRDSLIDDNYFSHENIHSDENGMILGSIVYREHIATIRKETIISVTELVNDLEYNPEFNQGIVNQLADKKQILEEQHYRMIHVRAIPSVETLTKLKNKDIEFIMPQYRISSDNLEEYRRPHLRLVR